MNCQGQKSKSVRKVIVRAYDDEPVQLVWLGESPTRVEVARDGETEAISLPKDLVYPFSKTCFKKMRAAYEHGDKAALRQLWLHSRQPIT